MSNHSDSRLQRDIRVDQVNRDLRTLRTCLRRVALGHCFDYCDLSDIRLVIGCKKDEALECEIELQRLPRLRENARRHAEEQCSFFRRYGIFCECRTCMNTCLYLNVISYRAERLSYRKRVLHKIVVYLERVRDFGLHDASAY